MSRAMTHWWAYVVIPDLPLERDLHGYMACPIIVYWVPWSISKDHERGAWIPVSAGASVWCLHLGGRVVLADEAPPSPLSIEHSSVSLFTGGSDE